MACYRVHSMPRFQLVDVVVLSLLGASRPGVEVGASVGADHLDAYLAEFTFRFNRWLSPDRALLFYRLMTHAAQSEPLTYSALVKDPAPKQVTPATPTGPKPQPASLALLPPARP